MTKNEMLSHINIAIKWAMENDEKILEAIQCKMLLNGFSFKGWGYKANKRMLRLNKEELAGLMSEIVECMYS